MDINEVARCKLFFFPVSRPCDATDSAAGYHTGAFLRLPEVMHLCGLSRSTIYELIRKGEFPPQVSLGGKNVAWLHSEITAWMAGRIAGRKRGTTHDDARSAKTPFFWLAFFRHLRI